MSASDDVSMCYKEKPFPRGERGVYGDDLKLLVCSNHEVRDARGLWEGCRGGEGGGELPARSHDVIKVIEFLGVGGGMGERVGRGGGGVFFYRGLVGIAGWNS